jgi:RNase H-like domain found in reverse transcriptase
MSKLLSKIDKQLSRVNDGEFPRQEDLCLDEFLLSPFCWRVTQIAEEHQDILIGRARTSTSSVFVMRVQRQQRWTVPEKVCFTIFDTVATMDYLLVSHDKFSILSDHLYLTYIYNPLSADPTLARNDLHKLQRLALKM